MILYCWLDNRHVIFTSTFECTTLRLYIRLHTEITTIPFYFIVQYQLFIEMENALKKIETNYQIYDLMKLQIKVITLHGKLYYHVRLCCIFTYESGKPIQCNIPQIFWRTDNAVAVYITITNY
jgi:hypothetical protein